MLTSCGVHCHCHFNDALFFFFKIALIKAVLSLFQNCAKAHWLVPFANTLPLTYLEEARQRLSRESRHAGPPPYRLTLARGAIGIPKNAPAFDASTWNYPG